MKILHATTHESAGGASIAAMRLHGAFLAQGVDSRAVVLEKQGDTPHVSLLGGKFSRKILRPLVLRTEEKIFDALYPRPQYPAYTTFSLFPSHNHTRLNAVTKDILHLHWVGGGFLSPFSLARLRGPVVWTMHDTFAFTGGCHFTSTGCTRYMERCGACPEICGTREMDISRLHWLWKRRAITRLKPVIVSPSKEYAERARQSGMLRDCRIEVIPNGLDTDVFRPIPKEQARELLGLPQHETLILFGAVQATSDSNKGFDLLCDALHRLRTKGTAFAAAVFGSSSSEAVLPCSTYFLGRLHDSVTLALAYSAADVFVCPSRQENLPNMIMESLACGTPVTAFSVGGIPDMVEHKVNGWLAPSQDTESLAQGIAYILEDDERRARMGEAARRVVEERYAAPVIVARYMALYNEILESAAKP